MTAALSGKRLAERRNMSPVSMIYVAASVRRDEGNLRKRSRNRMTRRQERVAVIATLIAGAEGCLPSDSKTG